MNKSKHVVMEIFLVLIFENCILINQMRTTVSFYIREAPLSIRLNQQKNEAKLLSSRKHAYKILKLGFI